MKSLSSQSILAISPPSISGRKDSAVKQYEEALSARAVLQRINAFQKEVKQTGLDLTNSLVGEEVGELTPPAALSETMVGSNGLVAWQKIINIIPAAIIGVDHDDAVVLVNPWVERIFRIESCAIIGNSVSEGLPSELADIVRPVTSGNSDRNVARMVVHGKQLKLECISLPGVCKGERRGAVLFAFVIDDVA
ncbi:MAG: PAS domain-containing protein [Chloroflexi bacterium]|nr:PAS domain-containing protein [Chloroflexota bacterium]